MVLCFLLSAVSRSRPPPVALALPRVSTDGPLPPGLSAPHLGCSSPAPLAPCKKRQKKRRGPRSPIAAQKQPKAMPKARTKARKLEFLQALPTNLPPAFRTQSSGAGYRAELRDAIAYGKNHESKIKVETDRIMLTGNR